MTPQAMSSGCMARRAVLGAFSLKVKGGMGDVMVVVGAGWMTYLGRGARESVMDSSRLTCRGGSADE